MGRKKDSPGAAPSFVDKLKRDLDRRTRRDKQLRTAIAMIGDRMAGKEHSRETLLDRIAVLEGQLDRAVLMAERLSDGWVLLRDGTVQNHRGGKIIPKKHGDVAFCYCEESLKFLRDIGR